MSQKRNFGARRLAAAFPARACSRRLTTTSSFGGKPPQPKREQAPALHNLSLIVVLIVWIFALVCCPNDSQAADDQTFHGRHYAGRGDREYLELLEKARRMFEPDPEYPNLSMLYTPAWNGLVEGPTWDAWWIQNSYGTTYCALPFLQEPFVTFLQNSQDLWFDQMGDGKRAGFNGWIAPDGCLCDAARPGWIVYRQGDGRTDIHDWAVEFTAAGIVLQAEALLISRDEKAIAHFLPLLERCAEFIESRRDPNNNLFLAGPAANLLAPSYAGYKKPDGTYGQAYLAGLSITYIAALDRMIEVEKLAGRPDRAKLYEERREKTRAGLPALTTDEGYFIKSLDPDGTKHGVFGAANHGYFEASPNHDAIAFRVVDDKQANRIYDKIASIPGLRPYDFIIPNYPSLDDMYEKPEGLWEFGRWVNGGHWSTCEARMILAYYRLGKFEDARRSMKRILGFAERWRMDNPLVKFGSDVYQPQQPINITYDAFGPPAAMIRGLFEYIYTADGLTLIPHIPSGITQFHQLDPIHFGQKWFYISTVGTGPINSVKLTRDRGMNLLRAKKLGKGKDRSQSITTLDKSSVHLAYDQIGSGETICIHMEQSANEDPLPSPEQEAKPSTGSSPREFADRLIEVQRWKTELLKSGLGSSYEDAHAGLFIVSVTNFSSRVEMMTNGKLRPLPEASAKVADLCYVETANKLYDGLAKQIESYAASDDPRKKKIYDLWIRSRKPTTP